MNPYEPPDDYNDRIEPPSLLAELLASPAVGLFVAWLIITVSFFAFGLLVNWWYAT